LKQDTHAKRLVELGAEIEHMVAAVAAGLLSPTLKARLEAAEAERTALVSTSCASGSSAVADLVPRLGDTYRRLVEHLERVPPRHVDRARTSLKGLIGEVRLIPGGEHLTAEFELEGGRLLVFADTKISVVAGARYSNFRRRRALRRAA
jgi:hypothetical protein